MADDMLDGTQLIAAERWRQISQEGWTPDHDAVHADGELEAAAVSYIECGTLTMIAPPDNWPWEAEWWKPSDDPIRSLVKAGALIAAAIDRLQREAS